MVDFQTALYDPLYDALGVDAVIHGPYCGDFPVRAIDKSSGVAVSGSSPDSQHPSVQTLLPAAVIMMKSLVDAGLDRMDLEGATIEMNGKLWDVKASQPKPSPDGEDAGELYLMLMERSDG